MEMCRTRKGWPQLILVVFGDELGRGHGVAQIKNLCELLQVPSAWGERKKGVSRAGGEGSSHVQLLLCPKPHPAQPRRPQGQRGVTGTPALSTPACRGLDPLTFGENLPRSPPPGVAWLETPLGMSQEIPCPPHCIH